MAPFYAWFKDIKSDIIHMIGGSTSQFHFPFAFLPLPPFLRIHPSDLEQGRAAELDRWEQGSHLIEPHMVSTTADLIPTPVGCGQLDNGSRAATPTLPWPAVPPCPRPALFWAPPHRALHPTHPCLPPPTRLPGASWPVVSPRPAPHV